MSWTTQALRAANAENDADPFLVLVLFDLTPNPWLAVVNNTENIVSRGATYIGVPFSVRLAPQGEGAVPEVVLEIDNVDPRIWQGLRSILSPIPVRVEVILASQPEQVLVQINDLRLREATASIHTVTGRLMPDTTWVTGFPMDDYTPAQYPGMFSG